jgi:hypothetical protein
MPSYTIGPLSVEISSNLLPANGPIGYTSADEALVRLAQARSGYEGKSKLAATGSDWLHQPLLIAAPCLLKVRVES